MYVICIYIYIFIFNRHLDLDLACIFCSVWLQVYTLRKSHPGLLYLALNISQSYRFGVTVIEVRIYILYAKLYIIIYI